MISSTQFSNSHISAAIGRVRSSPLRLRLPLPLRLRLPHSSPRSRFCPLPYSSPSELCSQAAKNSQAAKFFLYSQTDFCDSSHLGAQLFPRIREPAIWYFIWSAPPHSGRPFSTFRAPAARRILCAYGTKYYYGRGSGPWVFVLLGSELTSLISQLFWDQV